MKRFAFACVLLLLPLSPGWSASIGLFSDLDCSSCNLTIPIGTMGTFYISYIGNVDAPLSSAAFRVVGLPAGWLLLSVRPNPAANIVLGDPFGAGTAVAFPTIQPGDRVSLFTVQVGATSATNDIALEVRQHDPPINPLFQCPFAGFACGAACDWMGCVGGGQLFINSGRECSVGVTPATWSLVKQLFE